LNLLNVYIVVYLNNMLIYSDNMSQYKAHIKKVLQHLQKTGLYMKAEKYKFHFNSIKYLEYILSPSRLFMSSNKIKQSRVGQNIEKLRRYKHSWNLQISIIDLFMTTQIWLLY